ncbi:phage holin family protein [Rarobacter incanus]|uniref:Putative superfamily III holin-X n=1 Tax=Rarobacter incanus TaxID=153494 RepID=A0A542SQH8_9MICO|nr:phage holin family protein [Rarobacter incanus]TQK76876.1 putative superfamily III holin-X [Rarobacter incanus]
MTTPTDRPPLSAVIARAITAIVDLAKAEIAAYKNSLVVKLKESAIAIGLFAAAGVLVLLTAVYLSVAAYQGLCLAMPAWLAGLVLAAAMAVIAAALGAIGASLMKRHQVPSAGEVPAKIKDSLADSISQAQQTASAHEETPEA